MTKLNVQAIFESIDGEANGFDGAGQLTTFIRLKGCNLSCSYCDTSYSQSSTPENWMTIDEIIEQVHFKKVTITGGEPLLQENGVYELCAQLIRIKECYISIETNGTREPIWHDPNGNIRYIVDYKLPSSDKGWEMNHTLDLYEVRTPPLNAFDDLKVEDVIKFVIADDYDYRYAKNVIDDHPTWEAKNVFSPTIVLHRLHPRTALVPNMVWPKQLVEKMIQDKVNASFSLQLHKLLWPGATEER